MGNSRDYRARAIEFRAKAQRTPYPEVAAQYADLTVRYQRLADWLERRQRRSKPKCPSENTLNRWNHL